MTLLAKQGVGDDTRHDLVYSFTSGRTQSSRELFDNEIDDLLWKLQHDSQFRDNIPLASSLMLEHSLKQKRSAVLAIAQRTGLHSGTDFAKFNGWMENHSIMKKRLNKYTLEELEELLRQLRKLEANYNKSAENPGTKAWVHKNGYPGCNDN